MFLEIEGEMFEDFLLLYQGVPICTIKLAIVTTRRWVESFVQMCYMA